MQLFVGLIGILVIIIILWDAFESIVLPRRVTRRMRLTSSFYRLTWWPVAGLARRRPPGKTRDRYLSYYGPLSLIMLFVVWAGGLVVAFAMLHWSMGTHLNSVGTTGFFNTYLYMSGVTFFTLGFGDVIPLDPLGRTLAVIEAGMGFGFLAIDIGYLPVLYQSFSRREVVISMLDARAGSPPTALELLRRHSENGQLHKLGELLHEWERWSADLLESHLSYPVLCYYRSQHDNQSWLSSLTAVLDTCALVMVGVDGAQRWQAQLTFAMARHAVVDIAQIFNIAPVQPEPDRLSDSDLAALRATLRHHGLKVCDGAEADARLKELRGKYEPFVYALACDLLLTLPPWVRQKENADNWQTSAWGRIAAPELDIAAPPPELAEDEHY